MDDKVVHLQGGSVNCDSSGLVDPLKISTKGHKVSFSEENLRGTKKLVSYWLLWVFFVSSVSEIENLKPSILKMDFRSSNPSLSPSELEFVGKIGQMGN